MSNLRYRSIAITALLVFALIPGAAPARASRPSALASADILSTSPVWSAEGNQAGALFGGTVTSAGDVNGDGFADVAVAAFHFDNGEEDEGQVFLYLGGPAGLSPTPAWSADGDRAGAMFGLTLAPAGDVNGDGFADLAVGAPHYSTDLAQEGLAALYLGGPGGLGPTPAWRAEGDLDNANFGYGLSSAGDVNGDGFADLLVGGLFGRAHLYLGGPSGLSPAPGWVAQDADAFFGSRVGAAGDVNGDGFDDLVVSSPVASESTRGGRVSLYLGGPAGPGASPAWSAKAAQPNEMFGQAARSAGDVNGDGFADLVVGAPGLRIGERPVGRLTLYLGSPDGLAPTPSWTGYGTKGWGSGFAGDVGPAGDINADGFADVVVGSEDQAFVYLGGEQGLSAVPAWVADGEQREAWFGRSAAGAGDVNGDGFGDVVVGAFAHSNGQEDEGAAFLYYGGAGGGPRPAWSVSEGSSGSEFGAVVAAAGDVDGDGYADLLAGAPGSSRAYLYPGGPGGPGLTPAWTAEGGPDYSAFATALGSAGDVNADGYADVLVGASWFDGAAENTGRALLYLGGPGGLSKTPAWVAEGERQGANFGHAVGSAGDVNNDGFADVIVGAIGDGDQPFAGRALLYLGGPGGLSPAPAWVSEGDQGYTTFGFAAGAAGDVNGDGFADVIVGAPRFDGAQEDAGAAYLYLGGPGGLSAAPAWSAAGDRHQGEFGFSVAAAGDVNADGFADVIVGGTYDGHAYLYLGGPAGLSPAPAWVGAGEQPGGWYGRAVGGLGDVNADGFADVVVGQPGFSDGQGVEGRVYVYLGGPAGLGATPAWAAEGDRQGSQLGWSAAGAGDVNGDGRGDLIAGTYHIYYWPGAAGRAFLYDDMVAPTATVAQAATQSDPTTGDSILFEVSFSEPVTGFDSADVTLGGTAGATTASVSGGGAAYTVAVGGMVRAGSVSLTIAEAGAALDMAGNPSGAAAAGDNSVAFRARPSDVSVERAAGQADPAGAGPIRFAVTFAAPVSGFDAADVILGGTAGATTARVSGGGAVYTVEVSGMARDGTVSARVPAGAASYGSGAATGASRGADNTVVYDTTPPGAALAIFGPRARNTPVGEIIITLSEPVLGLDPGDLSLTRDGAALSLAGARLSGGGTRYLLRGLAALTAPGGSYQAALAAGGGVTDLAGNGLAGAAPAGWRAESVPPVTTASFDREPYYSGCSAPCFLGEVTVTLASSEPGRTFYQFEKGYTWSSDWISYSGPFSIGADGIEGIRVNYYSVDALGNIETIQSMVVEIRTFPTTPLLDRFSRADGPLGTRWRGPGAAGYSVAGQDMVAGAGGPTVWAKRFGADQEAYVTLDRPSRRGSQLLILKARGPIQESWTTWSLIAAGYEPTSGGMGRLVIATHRPGEPGLTVLAASDELRLEPGMILGAQTGSDGTVRLYLDGLERLSASAGKHFARYSGQIGLWASDATGARLDDFGGGGR